MPEAVKALLKTGFTSLNRREDGCRMTGMLPLHVAIANSLDSTYDFLTTTLPRSWRVLPGA